MNYAIIEAEQGRMSGKTNTFLEKNNSVEKISLFDTGLLSFSKEELKVLKMIANARSESNSYVAFSNKLIEINAQIHKTIPKTKQENLFYITAALYYGLKEINNFAKNKTVVRGYEDGNVSPTPKVRLKSGKIEDNSGGSWWNDPSYLASVWAVAVVEPTPIGKAVAVVLTGIVGSYYVLTRADCIDEFVSCKLYSNNDNCADCLHYCSRRLELLINNFVYGRT